MTAELDELDCQIAEARGWERKKATLSDEIGWQVAYDDTYLFENHVWFRDSGWQPTRNARQAMVLLEEMPHWQVTKRSTGETVCFADRSDIEGNWYPGKGATPCEAICRAWLAWRRSC